MRSEQEVRQALAAMEHVQPPRGTTEYRDAIMVKDVLKWVLDQPSQMATALPELFKIIAARSN